MTMTDQASAAERRRQRARLLVLRINEITPAQWDDVWDSRDQELIEEALSAVYEDGRVAGLEAAARQIEQAAQEGEE